MGFWSPEKSVAVGVSALALALGGLVYSDVQETSRNEAEIKDTFVQLDRNPMETFNSITSCKARGYTQDLCEKSKAAALKVSRTKGMSLEYDSGEECNTKHNFCSTHEETVGNLVTQFNTSNGEMSTRLLTSPMVVPPAAVGTIQTTTPIEDTTYLPPIVGWQAAKSDLTKAVPLYSGPKAGTGVRLDGKTFSI